MIINVEDKSFYSNIGISFVGILRSSIFLIPSFIKKEQIRGASTITQQIVRQFFFNTKLSFVRKFKEIIYATLMNFYFSKNHIFEMYINNAYFGYNVYGFSAAANAFFGKDIKDLEIDEIASLVGMLKGPMVFSPIKNFDNFKKEEIIYFFLFIKTD